MSVTFYLSPDELQRALEKAKADMLWCVWQGRWSIWPRPPLMWDSTGIAQALREKGGECAHTEESSSAHD